MTTLTLTRPVFDFSLIRMVRNTGRTTGRTIGRTIGRILGSIAAGQRAADDFRRLDARTDAQLAACGIRRADVARAVFERHFG